MEGQNVVYNTSPGPYVGPPLSVRAPLGHIKGRARPLEHRLSRRTQALATLTLSWEGNTTHSGRRVLRSGGPNHSKSCCARRVLEGDRSRTSYPPSSYPLRA